MRSSRILARSAAGIGRIIPGMWRSAWYTATLAGSCQSAPVNHGAGARAGQQAGRHVLGGQPGGVVRRLGGAGPLRTGGQARGSTEWIRNGSMIVRAGCSAVTGARIAGLGA
jgi:hypothetical protein